MNRKYLRKKVVQVLKDAKIPNIDQDVFSQRSVPSDVDSLPVVLVYTKTMQADRLDESPKRYIKDLDVMIEVVTQHDTDECLADEMDDLSMLVEKAIEDSIDLEKCTEYVNLKTVINDTEGDGQSPIGSSVLTFTIGYVTEPRTDWVLPDLKTINTTYNMNGNEDGAQDILTGLDTIEE